jgi:hypothetical protein
VLVTEAVSHHVVAGCLSVVRLAAMALRTGYVFGAVLSATLSGTLAALRGAAVPGTVEAGGPFFAPRPVTFSGRAGHVVVAVVLQDHRIRIRGREL